MSLKRDRKGRFIQNCNFNLKNEFNKIGTILSNNKQLLL